MSPDVRTESRDPGGKAPTENILARPHASLEIVGNPAGGWWRCTRCGTVLGPATDNYKQGTLVRVERLENVSEFPLPSGEPFVGEYHQYICPGCATLLQVDVYCPSLGGESVLWDINLGR